MNSPQIARIHVEINRLNMTDLSIIKSFRSKSNLIQPNLEFDLKMYSNLYIMETIIYAKRALNIINLLFIGAV